MINKEEKNKSLHIRITDYEEEKLSKVMKELGETNRSEFVRDSINYYCDFLNCKMIKKISFGEGDHYEQSVDEFLEEVKKGIKYTDNTYITGHVFYESYDKKEPFHDLFPEKEPYHLFWIDILNAKCIFNYNLIIEERR